MNLKPKLFVITLSIIIFSIIYYYTNYYTPPVHFTPHENFPDLCHGGTRKSSCPSDQLVVDSMSWHKFSADSFKPAEMIDLRNVLLVIWFKEANYFSASKMYALYGQVFGDVFFCGPEEAPGTFWPHWSEITQRAKLASVPDRARFVTYGASKLQPGENAYYCINAAMEYTDKQGSYDGLLLASEDVLLQYWNWADAGLSVHQNWRIESELEKAVFAIDQSKICAFDARINTFSKECAVELDDAEKGYKDAMVGFYNELQESAKNDIYWKAVLDHLVNVTGGNRRLIRGSSEIVYISNTHLGNTKFVLQLLKKHGVSMQTGIMTAFHAIIPQLNSGFQLIKPTGYNFNKEHLAIDVYNPVLPFSHPFGLDDIFRVQLNEIGIKRGFDYLFCNSTNTASFKDWSLNCVFCYLVEMANAYSTALATHFGQVQN